MKLLSSKNRSQIIQELTTRQFDLLVIGGGITGAGIALDAASRGLKVALVEKRDFAAGTSSKSTKLIHGGLRYLKQLEIALVREVGRERAIVHRLAPHLVTAEKMLLPLVEGGTYGELATSMGLWVYDLLAGVQGTDKRVMLSKAETLKKEPLLKPQNLRGGGYYAEYRTDDARLTIENIKTAAYYEAVSINYTQAEGFLHDDKKQINGVRCRDLLNGELLSIKAHFVVSAAGPWVDKLRQVDGSLGGKRLFLSKGVHIVVPHERLPVRQAVYFDNHQDGRMIFAIPRQRVTYIGTTDTPYKGDINEVPIHQEDVDYLLEATNAMFPSVKLTSDDVESSWAGLRPLIYEEGKSASEMSRKDEIFESGSGLLSIAGGKLTGYRKMAERIVDLVIDRYENKTSKKFSGPQTKKIPLRGGPFEDAAAVGAYRHSLTPLLRKLGLTAHHGAYLIANYGRQTTSILEKMETFIEAEADPEVALVRAEAWYTIHYELATTLTDFFNRRTGRLYFNLPSIAPVQEIVAADFAAHLDWSAERRQAEEAALKAAIRHVTEFEYAAEEQV